MAAAGAAAVGAGAAAAAVAAGAGECMLVSLKWCRDGVVAVAAVAADI